MHRRIFSAEKGKGVVLEFHPAPQTTRVRVPIPDNTSLQQKHSLTHIGRVTNPISSEDSGSYPFLYWTEQVVQSIGEDIGTFETDEVSTLSMRMRVHVNGRLPLIKSYVVEFSNGDQVNTHLVCEKLEKHCFHCFRLDHKGRDWLEAKHQKKAIIEKQEESQRRKIYVGNKESENLHASFHLEASRQTSPHRDDQSRSLTRYEPRRQANFQARGPHLNCNGSIEAGFNGNLCQQQPRGEQRRDSFCRRNEFHIHRNAAPSSRNYEEYHGDFHMRVSPRLALSRDTQTKELPTASPLIQREPIQEKANSSRDKILPPARGIPLQMDVLYEAQGEIQDVMEEYTNVADPSESVARRERLRQADAQGQLEEAPAQMVRDSIARNTEEDHQPASQIPNSQDQGPLAKRLGPLNQDSASSNSRNQVNFRSDSSERIPVANRIGHVRVVDTALEPIVSQGPVKAQKRKPERPSRKRIVSASLILPGTNSRKRRVQNAKSP
ncbi:LOW QUALITY PROTEIN: hypothetical protein N665_1373s0003 [Sinapis alba]|nr:LOW QUALITY PROTEIN: hypothetical protein N665_1373s0003 [Sinapis alba]